MSRTIAILVLFSFALFASEGSGAAAAKAFADRIAKSGQKINYSKRLPKDYRYLADIIKGVEKRSPVLTIAYLTSSSVPEASHIYYSRGIRKLEENFRIQGKMCMRGIDGDGFGPFVEGMMTRLQKDGENRMGLDFCPELFEEFNITEVPAFVVSVCDSTYLHIEECAPKYIVHGDASLKLIFQKLSEENSYFKEMYEAL